MYRDVGNGINLSSSVTHGMIVSWFSWEWNFVSISLVIAMCAIALVALIIRGFEHAPKDSMWGRLLNTKAMTIVFLILVVIIILGIIIVSVSIKGTPYINEPYRL